MKNCPKDLFIKNFVNWSKYACTYLYFSFSSNQTSNKHHGNVITSNENRVCMSVNLNNTLCDLVMKIQCQKQQRSAVAREIILLLKKDKMEAPCLDDVMRVRNFPRISKKTLLLHQHSFYPTKIRMFGLRKFMWYV